MPDTDGPNPLHGWGEGMFAVRFVSTTHFEQIYISTWCMDSNGGILYFIDSGGILYPGTAIVAIKKIR